MNKIFIKGILVITLIITPSVVTVEVFAYELLKAPRAAIVIQQNEDLRSVDEINNIIATIDNNTRTIQRLIKDKANTVNKIDALMDLKATTKACLSDQQVESFQQFTSIYQNELSSLQQSLSSIRSADLNTITSEIISLEPNNSTIYNDLIDILNHQDSAINSLTAIIDAGSNALSFL